MKVRTFRDLLVWQRGMELARRIYKETERMPKSEMFGLTSQMRRAACSIPMNVAEGFGQWTRPKLVFGLRLATGSLMELMTAYELAVSLGMIKETAETLSLMAEEDRMIQAMIRKLPTREAEKARQTPII